MIAPLTVGQGGGGGNGAELGTGRQMRGQNLLLARRLVEQRPNLATLFMSGYMDDALGEDTTALRAPVDFIQKPFSPSALAARVREMLDRRRRARAERT